MSLPDLVIGYPDIPYLATALTVDDAASAGYSEFNIVYGSRVSKYKVAATDDVKFTFDLGSGVTASSQYVSFLGVKQVVAAAQAASVGVRLRLRASTDNFSGSDVLIADSGSLTNISSLTGPHSQDYILVFNESSAYRYWRVVLESTSGSLAHEISKAFFGSWFTFDNTEPSYPYSSKYIQPAKTFKADFGSRFRHRGGKPQKTYSLTWTAVSDSARDSFEAKIGKLHDVTPFILYTPNEAFRNALGGQKMVYAWLDNYQQSSGSTIKDDNTITLDFVEDVA